MTFKLEILYNSTWYDVSNYLASSQPVPFIQRSLGYRATAGGFSFSVSQAYSQNVLLNGTDVRIYGNNVLFFWGVIRKQSMNYNQRTYDLYCYDRLLLLEEIVLSKANIMTDIENCPSYIALDNYNQSNVGVLDFIENVLIKKVTGYTGWLNTIDSENYTIASSKQVEDDIAGSSVESFTLGDLRFDVDSLFAINQDYAISDAKIELNNIDGYDALSKRIDLLELLGSLTELLSLSIYITGGGSYKLDHNWLEGGYTISDNYMYDKNSETILPSNTDGVYWELLGAVRDRYSSPTNVNELDKISSRGTGKQKMGWLSNLMFFLNAKWVGANIGDVYHKTSLGGTVLEYELCGLSPNDTTNSGDYTGYRLEEEVSSKREELNYETDTLVNLTNIPQNNVELKIRRSIIKQVAL